MPEAGVEANLHSSVVLDLGDKRGVVACHSHRVVQVSKRNFEAEHILEDALRQALDRASAIDRNANKGRNGLLRENLLEDLRARSAAFRETKDKPIELHEAHEGLLRVELHLR